jgi:hypothetical protein
LSKLARLVKVCAKDATAVATQNAAMTQAIFTNPILFIFLVLFSGFAPM